VTLAGSLTAWYRAHRRPLPWRGAADPYAIWVSEVMLQQTRVDTVIPYYHRFLERFPTVEALAGADLADVLKAWEGLGYYTRARNLHRAAVEVAENLGGRLPDDPASLRRLPGFGPYMTGAVASIAFGRPEPVLDGNVIRVLARLLAISDPPAETATRRRLWDIARDLVRAVPEGAPGDFNQGLMELGATLCTPRAPQCGACPWGHACQARAQGAPEAYPAAAAKRAVPHHDIAVGVVTGADGLLLVRRPAKGLLGGLWEFPGGRVADGEAPHDAVARLLAERFGLTVRVGAPLAPVPHAFTHRRVTLHPFACRHPEGTLAPAYHTDHRWVPVAEVAGLALPRAHQKIAAALSGPAQLELSAARG
jgi:A/G-specific adenine glycosylase